MDKTARIRLKQAAEQAKIALSELEIVNIHVPYIYADQNGVKHILADLTRSRFEDLVRDLVARIVNACKAAVRDSNNAGDVEKIDELVLVGLSTKIPSIRRALVEYFKKQPKPRIDPEEAVVLGAAVQAGVLSGDIVDLLLMDATPLTLGVETLGGVVNSIIERNTSIPCKKSQFFTTVVDNQTKARIHILQGERPMAKDNESLGSFIFSNISLAPKGTPQLEITLDIDADSVLTVQVLDKGTGRTEHRQLKYTSRGYGLEDKATLTDQTPDLKDEIVDIARWEMPGVDLANLKVPPIQNNS